MDRLFVVNKPLNQGSNYYLRKIKRKYKVKKAGFSGTLDPFAKGCLIVAFGKYTQLFQFLHKTPKTYRTTIWLGALSDSLDIENVYSIDEHKTYKQNYIQEELQKLVGDIIYLPPKYSAKRIDGKRAYTLARSGIDFELKKVTSKIFDIKFINYCHPFISFDISVSEGSYIRSIAQELLTAIGGQGTLSYLERLNEGKFFFDDEKELNPLEYLSLDTIEYKGSKEWIELGKKILPEYLEHNTLGTYIIKFDEFFSIIEIKEEKVSYVLNRVYL
ncbi:MAG TPA: tRNA pseudouridine(55) synthase TruB [Arcobacter sp.]|nr:tRNA pseudouridine(55) synthase TruB [Arcobacter sp.]HIP55767.1 tRNA pseudouridine(55) synthase TruB [Arcobacter sp.]